jgi:iron(III) transport system substrate-binding protein
VTGRRRDRAHRRGRVGVAAAASVAGALAWLLAGPVGCARDSRELVVVYSPHDEPLRTELEVAFEREHPRLDVEWVVLGSQVILERVRAERAAPRADVWFGAAADRFVAAAREGLLAAYTPTWAALAPAGTRDDGDRWFGVYRTPLVIGFNSEALSPETAPRDWRELASPGWRGKVVLRDPRHAGSMQSMATAIFAEAVARDGSSAAAQAWLDGLDRNVRAYVDSPTELYQHLARKDGVVTVWNVAELDAQPRREKRPIGWRVPDGGVPILVDGIAVVAGAPHARAAQAFVEFVTSRPAVELAARRHARWPVRPDVPGDAMPAWTRRAAGAWRPLPLDAPVVADSMEAWMRRWTAKVAARPPAAPRAGTRLLGGIRRRAVAGGP